MTTLIELICTNAPTEEIKDDLHKHRHNKNYVNIVDKYGINALMVACIYNKIETVKLLLEANADIDFANEYGCTALMVACGNGYTEIVKLLLTANADIDIVDKNGTSALKIAELYEYNEIVELLNNFKKETKWWHYQVLIYGEV